MATVLILLIAGLILIALETVLPGLIAGIAGVICLIASIAVTYRQIGVTEGNAMLVLVSSLLVVGGFLWLRYFPQSWLGRRFVSQRISGEIGTEKPELLHQVGTALTNLRPSGTVVIGGRRVDVVTEGAMVERGSTVRVIAIEGMRVVVRAIEG